MNKNDDENARVDALIEEVSHEIITLISNRCGKERPSVSAAALMMSTSVFLMSAGLDKNKMVDWFAESLDRAKEAVDKAKNVKVH